MKQCTKCKGTNIQQAFVGWHNLKEDTIDGERYYENQYFNADDDVYFCKDCDETVNVEEENEPKVADNQNYKVGDKVKFLVEIERGMTTTVLKDAIGTIANIDEDFVYVTIHDEDCAKDLAEWDGQLYLSNTPVTDFDKYDYEGLDSIEKR